VGIGHRSRLLQSDGLLLYLKLRFYPFNVRMGIQYTRPFKRSYQMTEIKRKRNSGALYYNISVSATDMKKNRIAACP